jgi:LysM repeat protein
MKCLPSDLARVFPSRLARTLLNCGRLEKYVMNATNPFQVPSCFQVDYERRRRERFKRTFMGVLAAGILLLVALLIEGCMSEHARATASFDVAANVPGPAPSPPATAPVPTDVSMPQPDPQPAMSQSATAVSKANTPPAGSPATTYVVKSGDNLTRIARAHGTTVKAIQSANNLATDRIAVGLKLRIPTT